jgi:hypothetical protein
LYNERDRAERVNYVRTYKLTAFEPTGELITEDTFTAETDDSAKIKGQAMLEEKNLLNKTHRLASPAGKLLLFHS